MKNLETEKAKRIVALRLQYSRAMHTLASKRDPLRRMALPLLAIFFAAAPAVAQEGSPEDAPIRATDESPEKENPKDESEREDDSESEQEASLFFDPEDGMFDASGWLDTAYGFVPIPSLITEPALGGIGGVLGLAFFGERKKDQLIPPNLFFVGGGYTANHSWFAGAGYRGFLDKGRLRVTGWGFYAQPNIDLYVQSERLGEIGLRAEIKTFGGGARVMRKIGKLPIYVGGIVSDKQLNWRFSSDYTLGELELPSLEIEQNQLQLKVSSELDTRNNVFSPTDGSYLRLDGGYNMVRGQLPADYGTLYVAGHQFFDLSRIVLGFRAVSHVVLGEAPFYLRPFIALRGVPMARYQGDTTILLETEEMLRLTQRFGINVFGGWGKAMSSNVSFTEAENAWNVGAGFRYLLARRHGLQMGIDVARGPEVYAWYVQFGNAWGGD